VRFHTIHRNKNPLTISKTVAMGVARDYRNCPGHAHVRRIARSPLR